MKHRFISSAALFLAAVLSISCLFSCTRLSSTKEEKEGILKIGDSTVPYELYRYLALNFKKDYPSESDEQLKERVESTLLDIYTVVEAAKSYGLSPDGDYFEEAADNAVQLAIDSAGGKSEYKKQLDESFMTDSVFRFLTKKDALNDELYYAMINAGDLDDSEEHVLSLALGDEFICVKQVLITDENSNNSGELFYKPAKAHTEEEAAEIAESVREKAVSGENFDTLVKDYGESLYMMQNTEGYYVCRGMWEQENEDAVFALDVGEISPVVKSRAGFSVFLRCEKDASQIKSHISSIAEDYGRAVFSAYAEKVRDSLKIEPLEKYNEISISKMAAAEK